MKYLYIIIGVSLCGMLSSCFKDEALNSECDIEQAFIHAEDPYAMFYTPSDSLINVLSSETSIYFGLREADLTALAPQFNITEGATILPESGSVQDFSEGPVTYVVTSQDGKWSRTYKVYANIKRRTIDELEELNFEYVYLETDNQKYYVWNDSTADGYDLNIWATGNPGFALTAGTTAASEYPSSVLENGYEGKGVKLMTRSTGALGALVGMPIAAGNLFTGRFDVQTALTGATKATLFGVPVAQRPLSFSGYYQYTPGDEVTDKTGSVITGKIDTGDIYAILYRNTDDDGNAVTLNGDDVKTSSQIVATALIDEVKPVTEWTSFDISFTYREEIDSETLRNYGYNLAIIFSSSVNGANFEGAVGSTLLIDKVKITYEATE